MAQDTGRSPGNHIPTGRMASSGIGNRAEKSTPSGEKKPGNHLLLTPKIMTVNTP